MLTVKENGPLSCRTTEVWLRWKPPLVNALLAAGVRVLTKKRASASVWTLASPYQPISEHEHSMNVGGEF